MVFVTEMAARGKTFVGAVLCFSVAVTALWLGAFVVCPCGTCLVPDFDRKLLEILHDRQHPWLNDFLVTVTWLGSMVVLLPATVALAWHFRLGGYPAAAILLPLAVSGAWLLAHLCKLFVARPRPDRYPPLINMPDDFSFPSAHAMQIAAFALAWLLAPGLRRGWAAYFAAAMLVLLVALSQLYLQVHFPSDVLFGLLAGASWAITLRLLMGAHR